MSPTDYKTKCKETGRTTGELAEILGLNRATMFRRFQASATITNEMVLALGAIRKKKPVYDVKGID